MAVRRRHVLAMARQSRGAASCSALTAGDVLQFVLNFCPGCRRFAVNAGCKAGKSCPCCGAKLE